MLVSLLGVGTVLRLERRGVDDQIAKVQETHEYAPLGRRMLLSRLKDAQVRWVFLDTVESKPPVAILLFNQHISCSRF